MLFELILQGQANVLCYSWQPILKQKKKLFYDIFSILQPVAKMAEPCVTETVKTD